MEVVLSRKPGEALEGLMQYDHREHSFRFTPASSAELAQRVGGAGRTSLSIGTLQIEVAVASGNLLFVWGLHPRARWSEDGIGCPEAAEPGLVRVARPAVLVAGVSVGVAEVGVWSTMLDPVTGWVRTSATHEADETRVLIASGTVLGLRDGRLNSIWLRPTFE